VRWQEGTQARAQALRGRLRGCLSLAAAFCALAALPASANAAAPTVGFSWASDVSASTARLHGSVNPSGLPTVYRFDYLTEAAYEANLAAAKDGFAGASRAPKSEVEIGEGSGFAAAAATASGLSAETRYVYRLRATNGNGTSTGEPQIFVTQPPGGGGVLADGRGWEMVSPVDKNGGRVDAPGAILGGGVLQASAGGGVVTYGSSTSFAGGVGAPPASQYLAIREAGGWSNRNISVPLFAGSFGTAPEGVPYRLFSADLSRGLLLNGQHCRGEEGDCPVLNPPLPGSGAPAGYQDLYLREGGGTFLSLLTAADVANSALGPADFDLTLAGASPDLRHAVLSSCAALTPDASEVLLGEDCDPTQQNLYLWSSGGGLTLVNASPGAALAAPGGAVSADGTRVYWSDDSGLLLHQGSQTLQVDAAAGGGGTFQVASDDGSVAYFTKAGHLWRYQAGGAAADLTPGGGVLGVLGASSDGSSVYYLTASGLFLRRGAETIEVGESADAANYPPATGMARVSADGTKLLFLATAQLTGYDNTDTVTDLRDAEVYLYDTVREELTCVSCNPTNSRPIGPSRVPGALLNGEGPGKTQAYRPRVMVAAGKRVFFESADALVSTDTNNDWDVYQWERRGVGSCKRGVGCLSLISSGRAAGGASFVDASEDGADAFFLTDGSLVGDDPGSVDLYDARVGGGFPEAEEDIPCEGNACQGLLSEPNDPALNTTLAGLGNPKARYLGAGKPCRKGFAKRKGRCVKTSRKKSARKRGGSR